jgi:hypothetical protein
MYNPSSHVTATCHHVTATCHHVTATCHHMTAVYQCRNITPPSEEACPQASYVHIMPVGRFYLCILPVAYPLRYTSTPPTRLGTLGVLVY